jgi:hypothetical protein
VQPGTVKFEVFLSQWNFTTPGASLRFHLSLQITPAVTSISEFSSSNGITTYSLISGSSMVTKINLIGYGLIDNSTIAPVGFNLTTTGNNGSTTYLDLTFDFPHFDSTFFYDPDFSVTLPDGSIKSSDDSSSSPNLLPLLALLALVLVPSIFVVSSVVIAISIWIRLKRLQFETAQNLQGGVEVL